jgi:hypothetical protein
MATIGDLVIKVGGNIDGFTASMSEASASAERFTSGITSQISQAGTLFDQYGRVIASTTAPLEAVAKQHTQLTKEVGNLGRAVEGMGFNFRYAFFGIKDVMEGRFKFAIAEAANELVGMGSKALAIGAGVAAIAVGIFELGKFAGAWGGVSEAEKKATEEAAKLDKQILEINKHVADTAQQIFKIQFGALTAGGKDLADSASKTAKDKALEASYQTMIREEKERLNALIQAAAQGAGTTEVLPFDDTVKSEELTKLQHKLKEIQTQIFDDQQEERLKALQLGQAELDDTQSKVNKQIELEKDATSKLKSADEDRLAQLKASHQTSIGEVIRYWQARLSAESGNAERVHDIGITLGNLYQENDRVFERVAEHGRKVAEEQTKKAQEWKSKLEVLVIEAEQLSEKIATDDVEKRKKLTDIGAKSVAQGEEGAASFRKLDAERAYGLLLNQNGRARIALETQLEAADAAISEAKIEALTREQLAETDAVKKAELGLELQREIIAAAERQFQIRTKLAELEQKDSLKFQVQTDLFHAVTKSLPAALGGALSKGIVDGKNIGKEIVNSLKNIGQQLFGQLITQAIEKMVAELILNTAIGAWLGSVFGTSASAQVAASAANTAALHANTLAQLKSGVSGIAGAASGAAGAAGSAATSFATGLTGPLIAAAGGIIGGFISGIFTLIGDNKIVKAINATTAAVLSLRTAKDKNGSNTQGGSGTPSQDGTRGVHGFMLGLGQSDPSSLGFGGFLQGLLGLGDSQAIPVRIVQSWGDIARNLLTNFLGFADGGVPPLGVPSIVGERGPELFIPHQLGSIIPNNQLKSFASSGSAAFSSISSSSSGDQHFTINMHGVNDVRQFSREMASFLKSQSPRFSPFAT